MKSNELEELFTQNGAKQADFVRWAADKSVNIRRGDVSRHITGGTISRWAELAYLSFFAERKAKAYFLPDNWEDKLFQRMKAELNKDFNSPE